MLKESAQNISEVVNKANGKEENGKFKILTCKHNMQSQPCQPLPNRSDVNI